ncbi:Regulator of SigK OS=Afipia felis OX=1035 GN=BN961_02579 PE=4 SV=1 [Afipia felis]
MMAYSDDHIALAAEYALGTLNADERELVETMLIVDPGFLAVVRAWEHKLAPLHQMVPSVDPPAALWSKLREAVAPPQPAPPAAANDAGKAPDGAADPAIVATDPAVGAADPVAQEITSAPDGSSVPDTAPVPDAPPADPPSITPPDREPEPAAQAAAVAEPAPQPASAKPSSAKRVPIFGAAMSAAAIVFAGVIGLQLYRPAALPEALRPKPEIRTVEVKTPPPPTAAQWVAALQSDARDPGFIVTVDAATRRTTVRRVGPPPGPGKSYQLWIVPSKFGEPRSIGVIDGEFTVSDGLAGYDADAVNNSIYAVTVEAQGGSPSGKPTAQPLWAGKLYESVPRR